MWWKFDENRSGESWDIFSESFILKKETMGCTSFTFINSRVTGPKFTKFTRSVAESSQMNFLKNQNGDIAIRFGMQ